MKAAWLWPCIASQPTTFDIAAKTNKDGSIIHKRTIRSISRILFGIPAQAHRHTDQYPLAEQHLLIVFPIDRGRPKDT